MTIHWKALVDLNSATYGGILYFSLKNLRMLSTLMSAENLGVNLHPWRRPFLGTSTQEPMIKSQSCICFMNHS
jgi:hypothetical protein